MGFLRVTLEKEIRRIRRDPVSLLISMSLPVLIAVLLRLISGGGGSGNSPTAHLLVVDRDDSMISRFLVGGLGQGEMTDILRVETVDETAGRERIDAGEASGLLIIPAGFGEAVLAREPTELELLTNPAQRILPGIIEETLSFVCEAVNGLQNVLEYTSMPLLQELSALDSAPPDRLVSEISVSVNQLINRAEPYLFPPAIEVETISERADNTGFDFGTIFFPSMLFLGLIFTAQSLSTDLWREKTLGTLRRNLCTPQSLSAVLLGKLVAGALVLALVAMAGLSLAKYALGMELAGLPLAVLWATGAGVMMLLFFLGLQILASTERAANLLANAVIFPMVMVGGAFFPFEAMPDWLVAIGRWTPNGAALLQLKEILGGTAEPATLALTAGVLAAFTAALFVLTVLRLVPFARS